MSVYYFSLLFKAISSAIIVVEVEIFFRVLIFEKFHRHSNLIYDIYFNDTIHNFLYIS